MEAKITNEAGSDANPGDVGRMPIGARRLVLLGALGIPVGLVAGPYLLGLQLLSVAGVVAIAVALSYQYGKTWCAGWSWLTAGAGVAWAGSTIAYWLTIIMAADAAAPAPPASSVLFNVGVAACAVMAVSVLAAAVSRFRAGRSSPSPGHRPLGSQTTP